MPVVRKWKRFETNPIGHSSESASGYKWEPTSFSCLSQTLRNSSAQESSLARTAARSFSAAIFPPSFSVFSQNIHQATARERNIWTYEILVRIKKRERREEERRGLKKEKRRRKEEEEEHLQSIFRFDDAGFWFKWFVRIVSWSLVLVCWCRSARLGIFRIF